MRPLRAITALAAALLLACATGCGSSPDASSLRQCPGETTELRFGIGNAQTASGIDVKASIGLTLWFSTFMRVELDAPSGTSVTRVVAFKDNGDVVTLLDSQVPVTGQVSLQAPTLFWSDYTGGAVCVAAK